MTRAPAIIYLPDQSRPAAKKKRSGSANRQRQHLERFRTDDAEHAALHEQARASGKSLGGYLMEAAAIAAGIEARARRRSREPGDDQALLQALADFNRFGSNLNQIAHAANRLALIAEEHGGARLAAAEVRELRRAAELMGGKLEAPLAAIRDAVRQ
jgi:hypothetical protein